MDNEEQKAGRAQNGTPETQVERPEQSAHIRLPEHLMREQFQSKADEEQPADDAGRPPDMVSSNLGIHKITVCMPIELLAEPFNETPPPSLICWLPSKLTLRLGVRSATDLGHHRYTALTDGQLAEPNRHSIGRLRP